MATRGHILDWTRRMSKRNARIESVKIEYRTGKRSNASRLETLARKQVRRIKYVESMPSYVRRGY